MVPCILICRSSGQVSYHSSKDEVRRNLLRDYSDTQPTDQLKKIVRSCDELKEASSRSHVLATIRLNRSQVSQEVVMVEVSNDSDREKD